MKTRPCIVWQNLEFIVVVLTLKPELCNCHKLGKNFSFAAARNYEHECAVFMHEMVSQEILYMDLLSGRLQHNKRKTSLINFNFGGWFWF